MISEIVALGTLDEDYVIGYTKVTIFKWNILHDLQNTLLVDPKVCLIMPEVNWKLLLSS